MQATRSSKTVKQTITTWLKKHSKNYAHLNHHHCEDLLTNILVNTDATENTTLLETHCYIALQPISLKSTTSKCSSPTKVTTINTGKSRRVKQLKGNPQQSTEI
jgi:hypothetical protein